jgi:phage terminase large subunit-like protein
MREELQKFVVDEHRMAIEGKSGVWFRAKTTTQPYYFTSKREIKW